MEFDERYSYRKVFFIKFPDSFAFGVFFAVGTLISNFPGLNVNFGSIDHVYIGMYCTVKTATLIDSITTELKQEVSYLVIAI